MNDTADSELLAGDSREQRECESKMMALLSEAICESLARTKLHLRNGSCVEVDGCNPARTVLCEAWAHQGPPKSAQKAKVMTDAAKLFAVGQSLGHPTRKILVLADPKASAWFEGRSWMAEALKAMGVEIVVVELREEDRARIRAAQNRQYR